jgi:DNA-binding FadR family transcriptional regulator
VERDEGVGVMGRYSGRGVHGQTVELLARRIVGGASKLDLVALQAELDVSLSVLRESLKVLAAKGMVDSRQKRGTFVRPRHEWNLLDADVLRWQFEASADQRLLDELHEVRLIIEPAAARLAAMRRTEADLGALAEAVGEMAQRPVEADVAFHRALLAAAHNELLRRLEIVFETGLAARDRLVHAVLPHENPVPHHRAVVEAVAERDSAKAEAAMRALLERAAEDVNRL